eukprot:5128052-Amphidinium_carterae.1
MHQAGISLRGRDVHQFLLCLASPGLPMGRISAWCSKRQRAALMLNPGKRCLKGYHLCARPGCQVKHPAHACTKQEGSS